jgi:uncharacterized membrane protein YhaH (DUF805 family)
VDALRGPARCSARRPGIADSFLGYPVTVRALGAEELVHHVSGPVSGFVALVVLVPWVSATVARLHDRGHPAWWLCWFLLPVLGGIVLFVPVVSLRGSPRANRYGPPVPVGQAGAVDVRS